MTPSGCAQPALGAVETSSSRRRYTRDRASADVMERVLRDCHYRMDDLGIPQGAWYRARLEANELLGSL